MRQSRPLDAIADTPLPTHLLSHLSSFADLFNGPTWVNALLLLTGTLLAPGRRTVTAALRILGREHEADYATYHRVLARAVWSSRRVAERLLHLLVDAFVPPGAEIVVGLDDTIERRWGPKIKARGIYRDPVRSSRGHFVKTSGLRWLCAMLITPVPWAGRLMALPVLTALVPSERFYADSPRAPKSPLDAARQMVLQIRRWLPGRRLVVVADSAFAAIAFLAALRPHACVVTRLRLDANLFAPAPPRRKGTRGRPPLKGKRLPKLTAVLADAATVWHPHRVPLWYGKRDRAIETATGTAIWYHGGLPPLPIRWMIVRDPTGELKPQAFLATDPDVTAEAMLAWFVSRWEVEVTFEEVRPHLGVETQRQWSGLAIARTTPALLGLFSLVVLWMNDLVQSRHIVPQATSWYRKTRLTFADAIAAVRREIWHHQAFAISRSDRKVIEIPANIWSRMEAALAHAR